MTYLTRLSLQNFRSYPTLHLEEIGVQNIILCGPNGAGKTNILEALSLLAPGRGLRGAKPADIQRREEKSHTNAGWTISANIETAYGPVQIGTGRDLKTDKRVIHINGAPTKTQSALGEWLSCLWLTPQMDRLFLDDKSARRRFFDRLIYTFDPGHMGRLTRYENVMRQRLKLLKEGQNDPSWLDALEIQMAETAVAIAAARLTFCEKLQNAYRSATREESTSFPAALLSMEGDIERRLQKESALRAEDAMKDALARGRKADGDSGTTGAGPHRSDFAVRYQEKEMPASNCSTGEQKALLIGIILAHARLLREECGGAPLLLLDEIVAHLDTDRRATLSGLLASYSSQVWMTGTDAALFADFKEQSHFYNVAESLVSRAKS